jgi:sulfhydrogenase subunit gamma (sulfur reductase)
MDRSGAKDFRPIRVREAWDETPSLRGLRLDSDAAFLELHRHPGQLVQVQAPGSRPGLFALANGPGSGRTAELLVRRGSAIADAIVAAARPGEWLETTHPHGPGFSIDHATGRDVLMFATGSGITPIRALIQHLVERREEIGRVTLLYGQRSEADFAYRREHADWERAKIQVVLYCSRAGADWTGRQGHIQQGLEDFKAPLTDTVAYLAGLPAMIASTSDQLAARGLPPAQIHLNF